MLLPSYIDILWGWRNSIETEALAAHAQGSEFESLEPTSMLGGQGCSPVIPSLGKQRCDRPRASWLLRIVELASSSFRERARAHINMYGEIP